MAGTHGIDVVALHKLNILEHQLARYDMTRCGIMLMEVNTIYHQAATIEQQLRILYLHLAETCSARCSLNHSTLGILQRNYGCIEIWVLMTPRLDIGHLEAESHLALFCHCHTLRKVLYHLATRIIQR